MIPHTVSKNSDCIVIAGPCSIDEKNLQEVLSLSQITVTDKGGQKQKAIAGTRVVGIKSRTDLDGTGKGMGIDYGTYVNNLKKLMSGKSVDAFELSPSAKMSIDIFEKTNMLIATEVCSPLVQLLPLVGKIPVGKMLPWNPAVNQLGWPLHEMGVIAERAGWLIGIKNGKWLGDSLINAESKVHIGQTPLEKVWIGLSTYASIPKEQIYLIQRGIETVSKGDYRSLPIHETARRAKSNSKLKVLFDPSHSLGPKMRMQIVAATIDAMHMKMSDGSWLYDGALIECGTSVTDTAQHISLIELQDLVSSISGFRNLVAPA